MPNEPAGRSDKSGNTYEKKWVVYQMLKVLDEGLEYVVLEALGDDERGIDIWIGHKNGTREGQQCKSRNGSRDYWDFGTANAKGIFTNWKYQLDRDGLNTVALVSPLVFTFLEDLIKRAKNTSENPKDFYKNQVLNASKKFIGFFENFCKAMDINPEKDLDLIRCISYLRRIAYRQFPDTESKEMILSKIRYLLIGNEEKIYDTFIAWIVDADILARTKIVIDEETLRTTNHCTNLMVKLTLDLLLQGDDPYGIINILAYLEKDALASFRGKKIGDIFISEFQKSFYETLMKRLNNMRQIYIQPIWIEENDFKSICDKNNIYGISKKREKDIPGLITFLSKMGIDELPLKMAINESINIELSITSRAGIFAQIISKYRFGLNESEKSLISKAKIVEFETGCKPLSTVAKNEKLLPVFYSMLVDLLNDEKDLLWMLKKFDLYPEVP